MCHDGPGKAMMMRIYIAQIRKNVAVDNASNFDPLPWFYLRANL